MDIGLINDPTGTCLADSWHPTESSSGLREVGCKISQKHNARLAIHRNWQSSQRRQIYKKFAQTMS